MKFMMIVVLVLILYLLAIMPRICNKADITPFRGWYYAHRGLHNNSTNAPENSLKAFQLAIENEYGIEFDVRLTKDNIPIIFHDYSLMRVCGVNKNVCELTYKELQELRILKSNQRIPLLTEALTLVNGKAPLIIELKLEKNIERTCEIVDSVLHHYKGVYCIESFHPFGLVWYKKNNPKVMRGQLSTNFMKDKKKGSKIVYFILQNLLFNFLAKPDFIAYKYKYSNQLSFLLTTKFYKAYAFAWTIRSQEALEISKENFEFFIFDSFLPKNK